jgi:hypothetical protein
MGDDGDNGGGLTSDGWLCLHSPDQCRFGQIEHRWPACLELRMGVLYRTALGLKMRMDVSIQRRS